ncbi:P27 family phage terminase small subunit [Streptococcus suis]|uniref:P27 family phage terminase small subunit n=1 Tax=Streptococcus suis TaxID=1307 RepID=UPI003B9FC88E
MKIGELKKELMSLINKKSQIEVEKVERYLNLVKIYKELDKTLKKDGYMIVVKNGAQTFLKTNSAIGEKVKINQALIKLGEFFDEKQEERDAASKNTNFADPNEFL